MSKKTNLDDDVVKLISKIVAVAAESEVRKILSKDFSEIKKEELDAAILNSIYSGLSLCIGVTDEAQDLMRDNLYLRIPKDWKPEMTEDVKEGISIYENLLSVRQRIVKQIDK